LHQGKEELSILTIDLNQVFCYNKTSKDKNEKQR